MASSSKKSKTSSNVFCFCRKDGKTGPFDNPGLSLRPVVLPDDAKPPLTQLVCGDDYVGMIDSHGQVLMGGSGSDLQLGLGQRADVDNCSPRVVKGAISGKKIVSLALGMRHTCAVDADGVAYSWGASNYAQLGLGQESDMKNEQDSLQTAENTFTQVTAGGQATPAVVPFFNRHNIKVERVCCGLHTTAFIDTNGLVYTCGNFQFGALGHGKDYTENVGVPTKVTALEKQKVRVVDVAGAYTFMIALSSNGDVYEWGQAKGGGWSFMPQDQEQRFTPQRVKGLQNVKGITYSSDPLALLEDGTVVTWTVGSHDVQKVPAAGDEELNISKIAFSSALADGVMYELKNGRYERDSNLNKAGRTVVDFAHYRCGRPLVRFADATS